MAATAPEFKYYMYGGTYPDKASALKALAVVKDLHKAGKIKAYEASVFDKGADGKVKIVKTEDPRVGKAAGWGLLTGAVVGLFFPAALLGVVGAGATGAVIGAIAGEVSKDFGRNVIKSMGDKLDAGRFGVIAIAHAVPSVTAVAVFPGASDATKKELTGRAELKKELKNHGATAVAKKPAVVAAPAPKPAAKAAAKPASRPAVKAAAKAAAKPAAKAAAKPAAKAAAKSAAKPAAKPAAKKPVAASKKPAAKKPAAKKPAAKKPAAKK
jgi:uncharacterized membrane protein